MDLLPVPAAPAGETLPASPSAAFSEALDRAKAYSRASKADNTVRAYRRAAEAFAAWCAETNVSALPASVATMAAYVGVLADRGQKPATIRLAAAAIAFAHRSAGYEPPTNAEAVRQTLQGIRRTLGTRQERKAPATAEILRRMLKRIPDDMAGKRDRALLLIGFATAMRRSELVALVVADVERVPEGAIIHLRRSKTDQEGEGREIPVPAGRKLRPVAALDAWLFAAEISAGPLFRPVDRFGRVGANALTDRSAAQIVKDRAAAAGLDPTLFAGHSLRAGFITSALSDGADVLKVMDISGHRKVDTVKVYDRRARGFDKHAAKGFL